MNPVESIEHGIKAKSILENTEYQRAYDGVRAAIIDRIEKCPLSDTQTAEDLRRCLKLLKDVQLNMTVAINSGKIDQFRLEAEQKRKDSPLRNFFR